MNSTYSKELLELFQYIDDNLISDYKIKTVTPEHFIVAVLNNKSCSANRILENILSEDSKNTLIQKFINDLKNGEYENFSTLSTIIKSYDNCGFEEINSVHILLYILSYDCSCKTELNNCGVTIDMIEKYTNTTIKKNDKSLPVIKQGKQTMIQSKMPKKQGINKGIEVYTTNLNDLSFQGKISKFIGGENLYSQIFNIFGKKDKNNVVVVGSPGVGKCLGRGTKILMYDGSVKKVEDIKIGDSIMGPDSKSRIVLSLGSGFDKMYKIHQTNGIDYVVNSKHILSLMSKDGIVKNIEIEEYINLDEEKKSKLFGWKPKGVKINGEMDEYLSHKNTLHKIVSDYGKMIENGSGYFIQCDNCRRNYIRKLSNIIGVNSSYTNDGIIIYTSISFLDNDNTPSNNIFSVISIEEIGVDEYFGFEISGDKLFLLEDCTVTHNTSLVKNIANILNDKELVPSLLSNKKILLFDPYSMTAGITYRGAFDERFKLFVEELKKNKNYILFIDDIHNYINDKIQDGSLNITQLLIGILNENSIPFICTTNFKDYKSLIENNQNLNSRLQKIILNQPSVDETFDILNESKERYEIFHNVKYSDESILECARLSERYLTERSMPDSAIGIMDEVGSMVSLKEKNHEDLEDLKEKLLETLNSKKEALSKEEYDKIEEIKKTESDLKNKISALERNSRNLFNKKEIYDDDVKNLVSIKTGIPIYRLSSDEMSNLSHINDDMKKIVIGQDNAIDRICMAVKRKRIGISDKNKPCVMLLIGKTGVGKTLVAKTLAKEVYGSDNCIVRLDMSEYSEKSSVTKITGSAPGYIGYESGGQLTEAIKNKKHCVLLLDEIEKAHSDVHNIFLQLFDEGRLTDNSGQMVDFRNVIILMTSNVGARKASEFGDGIGFTKFQNNRSNSIFEKELKKTFAPEFINRLDDIIYFSSLNENDYKKIIKLEIEKLSERMKSIGYELVPEYFNDYTVNFIFDKVKNDKEFGARIILRSIQDNIENKITDYILSENPKDKKIPLLF